MKLYHVYDGDEFDHWYVSKAEAVREAKVHAKDQNQVWVYRVNLGKLTLDVVRRCLEGEGYAESSEVIWTNSTNIIGPTT